MPSSFGITADAARWCLRARRLAARLRREDLLAGRVEHSKLDLLAGLAAGLARLVRR